MTHATILIGPLTRDFIRWPGKGLGRAPESWVQWSQPGGAVWHAGLALVLTSDQPDAGVFAIGTAGAWAGRNGIPGLVATGVGWRGVESATETAFVNRYDADRRRQTLLSAGEPLTREALARALAGLAPAAAVVSPLMPGDTLAGAGAMLSAAGAFVAADAQGFLRVPGSQGQIETRRVDLREALVGVRAVKFSEREFRVYAGLGRGSEWRVAAVEAARELRAEVIVSLGAGGALVALPGGASPGDVVDVAGPSLRGEADTTGAGDILIAMYARGRSQGLGAAAALDRAVG
ncbi:MAG: Sugar or nucleoside kinase, ribokinase family, partial [Chloroflexi bacterium]